MLVPVRYVSLPEVQRQLWFAAQVSRNPSGYLVPVQLRIDGPLDLDRLDRAIRAVVTRHEVLRTGTALVGDELVGVVHEVPCPAFGLDEIATDANADADADVTAWLGGTPPNRSNCLPNRRSARGWAGCRQSCTTCR